MIDDQTKYAKETLSRLEVHLKWESDFRNQYNEEFYEMVFDVLVKIIKAKPGATILDIGCGPGFHALRLARRGFLVQAIDFSESALELASMNIKAHKFDDVIKLKQEDILDLSFQDATFDYILCWGVLMHIPEIDKAISQLARVLKQGGILIISEGNMHSVQSKIMRYLKSIFKIGNQCYCIKESGQESWDETPAGKYMTRHINIEWLCKQLQKEGMELIKRMPGQMTEVYTRVRNKNLLKLIHAFNRYWFINEMFPRLAFGNIICVKKIKNYHNRVKK